MRALIIAFLFLATFLASVASAQDFYSLLGVGRDAKDDEIRAKFKKLARKYHPDAQRGLGDAEKEANRKMYTKIADAYETLLDPSRRSRYDQGARGHHIAEKPNINHLRNHLFNEDFEGDQIGINEINNALRGGEKKGMIVFFWSNNFPACVDAGLEYKKAAKRLRMSSMRVASLRCDDYIPVCRDILRIPGAPAVVVFPPAAKDKWVRYEKKSYEGQLLVDFAMQYTKAPGTTIDVDYGVLKARTPRVEDTIMNMRLMWPAVYMYETMKRSFGRTIEYDLIYLEHSPCFDCNTELTLALESYKYYRPNPIVRRIECGDALGASSDLCDEGAERNPNKAWSVLKMKRTCYYATKKPFSFSNEHCTEEVAWFSGKYQATEFLNFLTDGIPTTAIERITSFDTVRRSNDSYAIMYMESDDIMSLGQDGLTWLLLASRVANFPIIGEKGFKVRIAMVNCNTVSGCPAKRPWSALLSFGLKAKLVEPRDIPMTSVPNMVKHIRKEMEALHLHVLTPSTFTTRMAEGYKRGRAWVVLFNAGQWCPPCMQIKPHWPVVARTVQQHDTLKKKVSVAVVDCDQYPKLCQREKIDGFPAIFMYPGKDKPRKPFHGNKQSDAVMQWVQESLESNVQKMDYHTLMHHINSQIPVLSSFTAGNWCPPCNMLGPVLKQLSNKMPSLAVNEINCDDDQRYCQMFQIDGFPTLNLYYKGQKYNFNAYQRSADEVAQWIKKTTGQKFN